MFFLDEDQRVTLRDIGTRGEILRWTRSYGAEVEERNEDTNRSRMVAGYCCEWESKKDPSTLDVTIPEHDFAMRWNLTEDGGLWIVKPSSINEIGCIHTCQGLELDYVGVVIGPDLVVRDGRVVTQPDERARHDQTIRGYKKWLKLEPEEARREARAIILNTYRTLMTRGMKGCYEYCVDEETQACFERRSRGAAR